MSGLAVLARVACVARCMAGAAHGAARAAHGLPSRVRAPPPLCRPAVAAATQADSGDILAAFMGVCILVGSVFACLGAYSRRQK